MIKSLKQYLSLRGFLAKRLRAKKRQINSLERLLKNFPKIQNNSNNQNLMTKNIKQIQKENRKLILKAVSDGNVNKDFTKNLLTLSQVLLALKNGKQDIAAYDIYWENEDNMGFCFINRDSQEETEIIWDLSKETLEDQSEETQIAINQLLTK